MAQATKDPFTVIDGSKGEEIEDSSVPDDGDGLADAAASAFGDNLDSLAGTQEELDGTDYLKARFVGMAFDSLDREIHIGDEIVFTVKARCLGEGSEASKSDGRVRRYVKMDVQSVTIAEEG
jgi:hypothetical protein